MLKCASTIENLNINNTLSKINPNDLNKNKKIKSFW